MSKFKVTNPDEPIEIDLYQDIPSKDPDTGIDQIDDEGNILVKRYVTRSINSKGIANIKNALPQINTNKEAIAALDKYAKDNVASITSDIGSINDNLLGTQTDLSDLTQTVSVLQGKINGIQGIDIDEVQADVDALKKSAYLITGGVLKGDVSIQTPNTAVLTLTPKGSSSYASFSTTNDVLDCTTSWGKVFKASEEGKYFYGLADKATQDALGQNIADNYIKDITGANATLTITKGTGTTSILSVNNVLQAQKAIADKNNNDITTTYATKTENTSNLASAKAYADTKKNEAIASANSYTDQEKAKYLPLTGIAAHAKLADKATTATNANHATNADTLDGYHEYSFLRSRGNASANGEGTLWSQIGIKEYYNALPDGLSGVYGYGEVVSLAGNACRFDIYCSHQSSSGGGLLYRSGWGDDKKDWRYFIDSANISSQSVNYANSAGSVAWGNVSGRPTKVSQFTNDSGYITAGHNFSSGVKVSGYTITVG